MGRIEGRVADAAGQPSAGATVEVRRTNGEAVQVTTAADGTFAVPSLQAGTYVVALREADGRLRGHRTVKVASGAVARADLEVELQFSDSVTVTESRSARLKSETPASVGSVTSETIAETRPSHPSEIMGGVAGVWVNVTGGEGHQTAIRQPLNTNPVYLFLEDGVPTRSTGFFNHNALYEVNLPGAEGIEVTKGPGSALYGSDAIGGVVNVLTRSALEQPGVTLSLESGSAGWRRALGDVNWTRGRHGLRVTLNTTESEGWRAATDYSRQSGTLRWDFVRDSEVFKTLFAANRIDQQTAGSSALPEVDYLAEAEANLTPISFRAVEAVRLSTDYHRLAGRTAINVIPYVRYNAMDLLPNWTLTFDPTVSESQNHSFGVMAKVERELPWWEGRAVAGIDTDYSPGGRFEYVIRPQTSPSGLPSNRAAFTSYTQGATVYDYDVTYRAASPYVQLELAPVKRLHVSAGLRLDDMSYDYDDLLESAPTARHRRPADGSRSFRHLSPKLGLTYQLTGSLSAFAAYRHAFRAPSEGQLFRQGSARNTIDLDPVKAENLELGVRFLPHSGLSLDLSVYRLDKRDDILSYQSPVDGATEAVNAGHTRHTGIELAAKMTPARWAALALSYSYAKHTYEEWVVDPVARIDFSGNEQEVAPRHMGTAMLRVGPWANTTAALEATWLGRYFMDAANTNEYDGHVLANLRVQHDFPRGIRGFVKAMNLFDALYAESASYTIARGREFAPGRPRTFFAGIEFTWRAR
ncbi:MAG TPA: TonB-dependent receptor [Thermoanaerobaculia bacterium]|nr:TonB-dependent receptor [Thermoanaerobaculia bacterium]